MILSLLLLTFQVFTFIFILIHSDRIDYSQSKGLVEKIMYYVNKMVPGLLRSIYIYIYIYIYVWGWEILCCSNAQRWFMKGKIFKVTWKRSLFGLELGFKWCLNMSLIVLLTYFFLFGCAGSSFLHELFSSYGEQGLLSGCSVGVCCDGFSCRRPQAPGHTGFSSCSPWAH